MTERKPLSKKTRFDVFKRDGFTCAYCGAQPPKVVLHCDHVVAVANGGTNDIDNLVTACDACNLGKGARPLTSVPLSIEEKAQILREREEQIAAFNELIAEKRDRIEETAWLVANALLSGWGRKPDSFNRQWFASVERFTEALSLDDLFEAVDIAVRKFPRSDSKSFRYFCGICWRKIRGSNDG
jgi:hypothetical protein